MKTIDAVDFQPPDSLPAWSELPQHAGGPLYPARARPGIRSCAGHCGEALGSERALPAWRWLAVQRAYLWQLADFVAGYVADGEWSALESTIFALFADVGRMAVSAAHTPRLLRRARSLRGLSDGQLLLWCAASLPRPPRLRRLCTHPPPPARHHPRTVRHTRHRIDAPRRAAHTRTRAPPQPFHADTRPARASRP